MSDMRSFEHHIAAELGHMAGPEPTVDALAVARSVAAQAPKRRFQTMFSALKFVAAGVVLAMFSGFLFFSGILDGPNQPPVVGTSPSAAISAEPTDGATDDPATAEPTPSDAPGEPLAFTRSVFESDPKFDQSGIAALPTGEILVVGSRNGVRSHGWLSTDGGETWVRNSLGMSKDEEHGASDVIEWNGGFLVVGTFGGPAVPSGYVVMSPDGVAWTEPVRLKKAQFSQVQAAQDGLLVLGADVEGRNTGRSHATYHPAVFTSTDGMRWETHRVETAYVAEPDGQSGQLSTNGAARSDSGIWLVPGYHQTGGIEGFIEVKDPDSWDQSESKGLLWRSDDGGVSWTPLDLPILAPPGQSNAARAIAWTPSGFVLAIDGFDQPGSIWHSEDGLSWEQVADSGEAPVGAFAVDGQRVVAFSQPAVVLDDEDEPIWVDRPTPVFQSTNGRTWTESLQADFDGDIVDRATVSSGGRIVAIGRDVEPGTRLFGRNGPLSTPTLVWVGDPS